MAEVVFYKGDHEFLDGYGLTVSDNLRDGVQIVEESEFVGHVHKEYGPAVAQEILDGVKAVRNG